MLIDIRDQTGAALIVIEHDIPLASAISDELIALELGTVLVRGAPDDVIHHPAVVEGYLGSSEDVIRRSGQRATRARRNGGKARPAAKTKKARKTRPRAKKR